MELGDIRVTNDDGENTERDKLKKTDKEFINHEVVESIIDFIDRLELNKNIKDKLGLLSYKLTKEEFLDLS
jgi:hypothetical protein